MELKVTMTICMFQEKVDRAHVEVAWSEIWAIMCRTHAISKSFLYVELTKK